MCIRLESGKSSTNLQEYTQMERGMKAVHIFIGSNPIIPNACEIKKLKVLLYIKVARKNIGRSYMRVLLVLTD